MMISSNPLNDPGRQMDKELLWIIEETYQSVYLDKKSVMRVDLCMAIGEAVGSALIERAGEAAKDKDIDISEFVKLADHSIRGMGEQVFSQGSTGVARRVAEICVMFMQCRLMGMESPYYTKPRRYDNYNPFGNEGGFCNPIKLKMMDD